MINIQNISKKFTSNDKDFYALDNVSLDINKGEIFGIIGLSGAGKSTLLRCINRLEEPDSGKILIDNKDILSLDNKNLRIERKKIGMIFQHFNLLYQKTTYENIALPLVLEKKDDAFIDNKVTELLKYVGLLDKKDAYPSELSGGEKQRVAIARALVNDPKILLSDESTSALDPKTTKSILDLLKDIRDEFKITIILVTHQMEVVKEICDRVAIMDKGVIVESNSTLDLFKSPETKIAKSLISSTKNNIEEVFSKDNFKGKIIKLIFGENNARQTIISDLVKKFNLDLNIISGDINELNQSSVGYLFLEIFVDDLKLKEVNDYLLSKKVKVEVIK